MAAIGRPVPALATLVPAVAGLALLIAAPAVAEGAEVAHLRWTGGAVLVLAAAAAAAIGWHEAARRRLDPALVRDLHRTAATAYLRGELPAALAAARKLAGAAPAEPGAWQLLALVHDAAGDAAAATQARRRAARCPSPQANP
jgi:hypothetical protein